MKKIFKILPILALTVVGVSGIVSFSSVKESKKPTKLVHALPEGLADTYDVVTLSDLFRGQNSSHSSNHYTSPFDLSGYYDFNYYHSNDNTTGSVVVKFKQKIDYNKVDRDFKIVVRGSDFWSKGIQFSINDVPSEYSRGIQITNKEDSTRITEFWEKDGVYFKDNVVQEVELGAINHADDDSKIYCYFKLDGVLLCEGTYNNSSNYSLANYTVGMNTGSTIKVEIWDSDEHRLDAKNLNSVWYDNDAIYFKYNQMSNYSRLVDSRIDQWGHYAPLRTATLKYIHAADSSEQYLSALGLYSNDLVAINRAYNGITSSFSENDKICFAGLFAQPCGDIKNVTFNVEETNVRFIASKWYFESEYQSVVSFVSTYMHMSENTDGQCNTLYGPAKEAYNDLSTDAKEIFTYGTDFADAKSRLEAWAKAKGDSLSSNGLVHIRTQNISDYDISAILIVLITSIAVVATLSFIFIKNKRKHY